MTDPVALLAAYDAQVRTALARRPPVGLRLDWDGPLLRATGWHRGFVGYRSLDGVDDVDALIARAVAYFAERGEAFEWKTHSHDDPADLPDRLRANGFLAEDVETVVIGEAALIATTRCCPTGWRCAKPRPATTSDASRRWSPTSGTTTGPGSPTI